MSQTTYIMSQFSYYGYYDIDNIPEEMLDYLPENLEREQDSHDFN